jgi:hypothetical protein
LAFFSFNVEPEFEFDQLMGAVFLRKKRAPADAFFESDGERRRCFMQGTHRRRRRARVTSFFELFTANIRNPRTRRAYARAARMANPASTPTTRLYERLAEEATLDKVERVLI